MRRIALGFAVLLLAASGARAQQTTKDCMVVVPDGAMAECVKHVKDEAEKHLAAAYRAARDRTPPRYRPELESAERAWREYRDADCRVLFHAYDGSGLFFLNYTACQADRTAARTKELAEYAASEQ